MDFAEQAMNLFGESSDEEGNNNDSNHNEDEQDDRGQQQKQSSSSSAHSSSSSSGHSSSASSSASSSSSNQSSSSSSDGEEQEQEQDSHGAGEMGFTSYNNYNYDGDSNNHCYGNEVNEVEEESKDLFGDDNEDYAKTPSKSPYPVPGILLKIDSFVS